MTLWLHRLVDEAGFVVVLWFAAAALSLLGNSGRFAAGAVFSRRGRFGGCGKKDSFLLLLGGDDFGLMGWLLLLRSLGELGGELLMLWDGCLVRRD